MNHGFLIRKKGMRVERKKGEKRRKDLFIDVHSAIVTFFKFALLAITGKAKIIHYFNKTGYHYCYYQK